MKNATEVVSPEVVNSFYTNLRDAREYLLEAGRIMNTICSREDGEVDEKLHLLFLELMNKKIPDALRRCVYYFAVAYETRKTQAHYEETGLVANQREDDQFECFDFFPNWTPPIHIPTYVGG